MVWERYSYDAKPYDPGQIVIFFDNRLYRSPSDQMSAWQSRWLEAKYRLGWTSVFSQDLDPGNLRIIWYTHAGVEGKRDYPLHKAYAVLEMFDSLSGDGFRPMVLGWSAENPFPMIGGVEPPSEAKRPQPKLASTWSGTVSGHGKDSVHSRIMKIIEAEEEREADQRRQEVGKVKLAV